MTEPIAKLPDPAKSPFSGAGSLATGSTAKLYSYQLKTSLPRWPVREGILLEWNGGWGEIAPLPGFSRESLDEARTEILAWRSNGNPPKYPSVRFAIEAASTPFNKSPLRIPMSLLEEPRPGFSTLKLKLGHFSVAEAIERVKPYVDAYRLRLDCNKKWSLEEAVCFATHFSPSDFDYLEEPVQTFSDLIRFSKETRFPIAVDESIKEDLSQLPSLKAVVVKPTLVGSLPKTPVLTVLSSAFESSLGLLQIARLQASDCPPAGLDTFRYFEDDLLDPPLKAENGCLVWDGCNECPVDRNRLCAF